MNEQPVTVFVHINKNAGNTIRNMLVEAYGVDGVLDYMLNGRLAADGRAKTVRSTSPDVVELVADARRHSPECSAIAANLAFGLHTRLCRPARYVAFLRDPVQRAVSYWYFAYQHRDRPDGLWRRIEHAARDPARLWRNNASIELFNDQTRMICGIEEIELDGRHLDLAKRRIEQDFAFVGAVERFDACIRAMRSMFEWAQDDYLRLNDGDKSDPAVLPAGADDVFAEGNRIDAALHRWVLDEYLPARTAR
jgi:hypothetical protein